MPSLVTTIDKIDTYKRGEKGNVLQVPHFQNPVKRMDLHQNYKQAKRRLLKNHFPTPHTKAAMYGHVYT